MYKTVITKNRLTNDWLFISTFDREPEEVTVNHLLNQGKQIIETDFMVTELLDPYKPKESYPEGTIFAGDIVPSALLTDLYVKTNKDLVTLCVTKKVKEELKNFNDINGTAFHDIATIGLFAGDANYSKSTECHNFCDAYIALWSDMRTWQNNLTVHTTIEEINTKIEEVSSF